MEKTINIKLMEFKALPKASQETAINDVIQTIIDTTDFEHLNKNSNLWKAYRDCKKMQTPWFLAEYIWDYCKKMILKECRRWLYSADASMMELK